MAHVVKYERLEETGISAEAKEIFDNYSALGKIVSVESVEEGDSLFTIMRFVDEETADEYFAEMHSINENEETGTSRGTLERYNEE